MRFITAFALTLAAVLFAPCAMAAPLPVGAVLLPVSAEADPVAGAVVASITSPFIIPGTFSGTVTSTVITGDTSNPFGGLTFTYDVINDGVAGPDAIGRLTFKGFGGFATDASYGVPAAGVAPALVDRLSLGDAVGFSYFPSPFDVAAGVFGPATPGALLVVQTDAVFFGPTTANVIDGSVVTVPALGPAVVPEPATWGLLVLGLVGMIVGCHARRFAV